MKPPSLSTAIAPQASPTKLELGRPVYAIGSCFAENIAGRLRRYLFPVVLNPYGIAYNPVSAASMLTPDWQSLDLFFHHGLWRSLRHHSQLAWSSRAQTLQLLANADRAKHHALETSSWLLLTLGTSFTFRLPNGEVVANCHRLPQSLFQRRRLSPQQCVDALLEPLSSWLERDPSRRVVLTVSPVRYLRDGLINNSRGKAALLLACEALEEAHPRISYFPAYEILIDELRSYRFYEADLCHPSELAVELVWQRFVECYLPEHAPATFTEMDKLLAAFEHRPTALTDLVAVGEKGLSRLASLSERCPQLDFSEWKERFRAMTQRE